MRFQFSGFNNVLSETWAELFVCVEQLCVYVTSRLNIVDLCQEVENPTDINLTENINSVREDGPPL